MPDYGTFKRELEKLLNERYPEKHPFRKEALDLYAETLMVFLKLQQKHEKENGSSTS